MNFEIDGQKWYKLQASRTVNQAIGRVIRHISDYGAIFLCDERYASQQVEISKWMKDRKRIYGKSNIDQLHADTVTFFKRNEERFRLERKKRLKDLKKQMKRNKDGRIQVEKEHSREIED